MFLVFGDDVTDFLNFCRFSIESNVSVFKINFAVIHPNVFLVTEYHVSHLHSLNARW